jgi:hypothetical protein
MPKTRFLTNGKLIVIGRRCSPDEVALEAAEAMARWKRDLPALASYGYGQDAYDAFAADLAEHAKLRSARPEAVAAKKMSVTERDEEVSLGWTWVDRVDSILGALARTDQTLATALATAKPTNDAGLEAGIRYFEASRSDGNSPARTSATYLVKASTAAVPSSA